ncbi:diguanylate cyclase domain-containing protein [Candidatus Symbiopectobacterium sp. NZEC135]|uniref:diguanylate cyclase domain-containing protein n=1 Tax=Candidatus Symbiopectobacterium sp. NZEC135 TaxID=2820471 RepID=UPI002227A96F|nr:diguanylate cyclase [Candidatus Symbiopectobacterium sp. NZEC135]MCW2481356.1 diguanylate cyclase [Candidatus Symbiopectobacterium sp. NZEC135]
MWNKVLDEYALRGYKPRILIVDDQPVNIHTLSAVFHNELDMVVATSGEKALHLAINQKPDLILLDILMPDMDGYEVCRQLKNEPATKWIPVIFVTAETEADVEAYGFEIGAVDFISKPINPAIVRARVMTHLMLKLYMDNMQEIAWLDGLTGLHNRRRFDEMLKQDWLLCRREQRPLSIIMLDVDFFKCFNDTYGHQKGDECLQAVASALQKTLHRPMDMVFRYGGEEFACLLPMTDLAGAQESAQKMLDAVKALKIPHAASSASPFVTISIGIACEIPQKDTGEIDLLTHSDHALYQSKRDGRNCISTKPVVASK